METVHHSAPRRPPADWTEWTCAERPLATGSPAGTPRLPPLAWSLPGEGPARRTAAPGEPTQALPGPPGILGRIPSAALLARWDRFAGLELAGQGGMGRVYRGRDRRLRREVAVKVLVETRHPGDELREARLQARVAHPGVLPVLARGTFDGFPWFATPFVAGATLKDARPRLSLRAALTVVADVCRAAAAAHDQGIVHCDINPRNVMVAPRATGLGAWLIDFGIAQVVAAPSTAAGHAFGTPAYMAPEQAAGHPARIEPRTDVYGLGAMLYEVVSGRRPFSAETSAELLDQTLVAEPRPLSELVAGLPRRLEGIVRTCLAKEPADRYPGARALAAALDGLLAC